MYNMYIEPRQKGGSCIEFSQKKTSNRNRKIFAKLQAEDFYYVDKTMIIKELLDNWAEVNLFTRPRRFGKTLNMSMLKAFFELNGDKKLL